MPIVIDPPAPPPTRIPKPTGGETFSEDPGLELLPTGDEDLVSADDQLLAAEASLTDDPFATQTDTPPVPFGRSPAWDRLRERYVRSGTAPLWIRGEAALREWIYNALSTAQGAHAIYSDAYGIEDPDDWLGVVDPTDALATFEPRAREAVLSYDRVEDFDDLVISYDPKTGVISITDITVITDQADAVALGDIELHPNF